jgi:hypothetical protein
MPDWPALYALLLPDCRRLTRDHHEAEDICAEALRRTFEKHQKDQDFFDERGPFGYLLQCARNALRSEIRRRRPVLVEEEDLAEVADSQRARSRPWVALAFLSRLPSWAREVVRTEIAGGADAGSKGHGSRKGPLRRNCPELRKVDDPQASVESFRATLPAFLWCRRNWPDLCEAARSDLEPYSALWWWLRSAERDADGKRQEAVEAAGEFLARARRLRRSGELVAAAVQEKARVLMNCGDPSEVSAARSLLATEAPGPSVGGDYLLAIADKIEGKFEAAEARLQRLLQAARGKGTWLGSVQGQLAELAVAKACPEPEDARRLAGKAVRQLDKDGWSYRVAFALLSLAAVRRLAGEQGPSVEEPQDEARRVLREFGVALSPHQALKALQPSTSPSTPPSPPTGIGLPRRS